MTRTGIAAGTETVLAVLSAGVDFGRHQLLMAHTALSCRALLDRPDVYTAAELGEFVLQAQRGRELLAADESKVARTLRRLMSGVEHLAAETLLHRGAKGAPC